jgi:hypothetical protein
MCERRIVVPRDRKAASGYYSTDEALFYLTPTGEVLLMGNIDTGKAVWLTCVPLPAEATSSELDPNFKAEVEASRAAHRIP